MKVTVFIERENKTKIVEANDVSKVLKKLKINPETVIIVKNNNIITEKAKLEDKDKIRILHITSAG